MHDKAKFELRMIPGNSMELCSVKWIMIQNIYLPVNSISIHVSF